MTLSHACIGTARRSATIVPSCSSSIPRNSIGKNSSDNKDLSQNIAMDGVKNLYGIAEKRLISKDNVCECKSHLGIQSGLDRYGVRIAVSCGLSYLVGFGKPAYLKSYMSGRPCMGTPVWAGRKACRLSLSSDRVECGRQKRTIAYQDVNGLVQPPHTNNINNNFVNGIKNNRIVNHSSTMNTSYPYGE